jgi:hypothetical protein
MDQNVEERINDLLKVISIMRDRLCQLNYPGEEVDADLKRYQYCGICYRSTKRCKCYCDICLCLTESCKCKSDCDNEKEDYESVIDFLIETLSDVNYDDIKGLFKDRGYCSNCYRKNESCDCDASESDSDSDHKSLDQSDAESCTKKRKLETIS